MNRPQEKAEPRGAADMKETARFVRRYLAANLGFTCVTAWFSNAYFHIDEYFQVLELVWFKLGTASVWMLPWEHAAQMRPWMQPWLYWLVARVAGSVGIHDTFHLAFAFRLLTGVASWAALALFLQTTLPWLSGADEKRLHVRVATLLGFLPYLFVRTSSETLSMAAFTLGWAIALRGARSTKTGWDMPRLPLARQLLIGALLGLAFELRFQTAFLTFGLIAWLRFVGRIHLRALGALVGGGLAMVGVGALVDRWGYGAWSFPPWEYLQANIVEGAATLFGRSLPFAYAWLLPANVFFPVVVALLLAASLAWLRHPRHPITWVTLPFLLLHNVLAHKEERFIFPVAILATNFVVMAIAPSSGRANRVATWGWRHRNGRLAKALCVWSFAMMLVLAFWPLGWNHHVRFQEFIQHDRALAGDLKTYALPEFDLGLPAFHGHIYDIEKVAPDVIAQHLSTGNAREWLVVDTPRPWSGVPALGTRASLVWSEVPFFAYPPLALVFAELASRYDEAVRPPLRAIRFRSLYRLK